MNLIAVIILLALISNFVLDLIADVLNLRHMKDDVPAEFRDVYDAERYRKSQAYLRTNTRFGWVAESVDLLVLLFFWFAGGFAWLDGWCRSLGFGPVVTGLIFIGILMLLKGALGLPFSIYGTFVIEERFGFNKTTWATFILDRIKGLGLAILLGVPLLAGILAFLEYAGDHAWWLCWFGVTVFMLVMQFIAPTWIMPLFNKFEPLPDGELKTAILKYARSVNYPLKGLFIMDGSKRSEKSNAFFTGFGKNKRIALFDTLIERHSVEELVAVLAHEIGHYKKKHILQGLVLGILHTGVLFYLMSLFISHPSLFEAFYLPNASAYAGLIFFGLLFSPIDFFLGILLSLRSRMNEYQADRFVARTTADPESMVSALKKLAAHNLSNLTPHPLMVFLHYSHPPVRERIRAIRAVAA